ncbi:hypothetical protein [Alkalibacterium sp. 20]|uniref:hypothetical protein n=1 Tax=Alkalibacterium sp. 20 TaxID=1798803 RepID=UPI0009001FBA|nr:hypothetical protein [Alkalibacterium sp. 20]OJF97114.1 hypothetical protein AX762_00835 [Alkalibacterium sp. 20]
MNKYIKLMSFLLLIIVTLTGFGLYKAQASSPYPELKVVTTDGKPEYIEPFHFLGFVSDTQNYSNSSTIVFKDGHSRYMEDQTFLERIDFNYNPQLNDFITDHRSFMRGKSRRTEHYTETEQHVIYTGMESDVYWNQPSRGLMTIAVLNKETEEEETFSVSLGSDGSYYEVSATYVNYPNLTILAATNHSTDISEQFVYTFDVENPTEELTETINLTQEIDSNGGVYFGQSFDRTERFIPIQSVRQTDDSEFDYTEEIIGYFAFDTQMQELIDVPLFEEDTLLFADNDKLYVGKDLGDTIELHEMNADDQNLDLVGSIEMATPTIGREEGTHYNNLFNQNITLLDGRLYAYETQYSDDISRPLFQITDIKTQETLFNGTIEPKDMAKHDSTNIDVFEFRLDTLNN